MAKLRLIVQLIDDDGTRHQNDMNIELSSFKDPDLVNEEDKVNAFNMLFGFLMKSAEHFVRYWARSVEGVTYFNSIDEYARNRGMGDVDRAAMMAGAINSPEGTQHLQLPLQVLDIKEGKDIPRPRFPNRYKRPPVI